MCITLEFKKKENGWYVCKDGQLDQQGEKVSTETYPWETGI